VFMRLPVRHTFLLAVISLPVALAWPLRVWWLTGNPFYSLNVAGLFPTLPVFSEWSRIFHQPIAHTFSTLTDWEALLRYLVQWALPAVIGLGFLFFLLIRRLKEARLVAVFVLLVCALWVASIAHTAGGMFYSLRVLSPVFALLAIAGGYGLGLFNRYQSANGMISFFLFLVSVEALPKTLVLPENPYQVSAADWLQSGGRFSIAVRKTEPVFLERIKLLPPRDRRAIVTDIAGAQRLIASIGFDAIPFWSPEVAWLFDRAITPADAARRWQKSGLSYVAIGTGSPTANFVRDHVRWQEPYFTVVPIIEADGVMILQAVANLPSPTQP